jgi:hypothetical protein
MMLLWTEIYTKLHSEGQFSSVGTKALPHRRELKGAEGAWLPATARVVTG